jgi:hypothetical protein
MCGMLMGSSMQSGVVLLSAEQIKFRGNSVLW